MLLLAVNYHYVSTDRSHGHAIFPVPAERLASQLDELARGFEFIARDDLLAAIRGDATLPDRSCLVTFDDGLREQFELALPVLVDRGIPAAFFVCGAPLAEGRVLYVHKVHALREQLGDDALLVELRRGVGGIDRDAGSFSVEQATTMYRYDTPEAASLKYLLNVVIGPTRPGPIDEIFATHFDERAMCDQLYMSRAQVAELETRHRALGAHTYGHRPLAVLEADDVKRELEAGERVLRDVVGGPVRALSYPYGSAAAVSVGSARAAALAGFELSFTMERALNRSLEEPLLLARVDANDAPGGKAPAFRFSAADIEVEPGMTYGRERYAADLGVTAAL